MSTLLFLDDTWLFVRRGFERKIGKPELLSTYDDPHGIICMGAPSVWHDRQNSRYLLFYTGFPHGATRSTKPTALLASSSNGLDWMPEETPQLTLKSRIFPHQLMECEDVQEIAAVVEDPAADSNERLKALALRHGHLCMHNEVWTSADGVRWKRMEGACWHKQGAEPGAGVFYNEQTQRFVLTVRPDLADRRVCISETYDWLHYTEPEWMMQADALDRALDEIYGMPCFPYEGYVIGLPWMYHVDLEEEGVKFWRGKMDAQLTYSMNGHHFMRSLRQPLFANGTPGEPDAGVVLPASMIRMEDGSMLFYAFVRSLEHGPWRREHVSAVGTYRLRRDGFLCLETTGGTATLRTRVMLWNGGDLEINLCCSGEATCALLDHELKPIPGFSHDDCQPFNGDETAWKPIFQEASIQQLTNRMICVEIRMTTGRIYALRGDFKLLNSMEVRRKVEEV